MNAATVEPRNWSRQRWWTLVALVFAAHVGLIFAFGDRKPVMPRPPAFAPVLSLVTESGEVLALNDPTLFVLPHRNGFAGAAWLQIPDEPFEPFRWSEPPRLLDRPIEELGDTFARFMRTNVFAAFELEARIAPELATPTAPEFGPTIAARSTLRFEGELARRRLLNPPELHSWPASDLLTNSVVRVLVAPDGRVESAILLNAPSGSGSRDADQQALDLARAARFEPLRNREGDLTLGTMIFQWHTVPDTNAPAPTP